MVRRSWKSIRLWRIRKSVRNPPAFSHSDSGTSALQVEGVECLLVRLREPAGALPFRVPFAVRSRSDN